MKAHKNSKRFANMYLNAAGPDNAFKALEELSLINAAFSKSADFRRMLLNPMFPASERKAALKSVAGVLKVSDAAVDFVEYLCGQGAAAFIGDVLNKAVAIYKESQGVVEAEVISAVALPGEYDARLKNAISKVTGRKVELTYKTDPSLLGGVLVKVGSTFYDGSVRGQLRMLKQELVKG